MSRLLQVRFALAVIGIVVWGYGVSIDDGTVRVLGMVVIAVSLILRLVPKRFHGDQDKTT